jgi:hypothetical protein
MKYFIITLLMLISFNSKAQEFETDGYKVEGIVGHYEMKTPVSIKIRNSRLFIDADFKFQEDLILVDQYLCEECRGYKLFTRYKIKGIEGSYVVIRNAVGKVNISVNLPKYGLYHFQIKCLQDRA